MKDGFTITEQEASDAVEAFSKLRQRTSKYDEIGQSAYAMADDRAIFVAGATYSEIIGMRNALGGEFAVKSTKTDEENELYSAIVYRDI